MSILFWKPPGYHPFCSTKNCFRQKYEARRARSFTRRTFLHLSLFLKATVIGALEPPATPTCLTRTALSIHRPYVMALTPLEFKHVMGDPSAPMRVARLRPLFPHDDTHLCFVNKRRALE
ncbi:hypothetical protein Y032_0337g2904 [Ancylostoma ceylanicum]|uniref:Uncharacterized protein n=1 Tax=Ancylostoma ceylanicum TaxID=53326 RepID=A0A016RY94_9BILA|nr:hypothetical protein Y032_0337g2904 [Ancylostoma ceylanicum]